MIVRIYFILMMKVMDRAPPTSKITNQVGNLCPAAKKIAKNTQKHKIFP
jgi:hypothetical protein